MAVVEPRWIRLEPRTRDPQREAGTRADIHDPLWLLARQLQFGELAGEDTGSPVSVALEGRASRLTRYRAGHGSAAPGRALDPELPLEVVVEAEPLRADALRSAALRGAAFLRLLESESMSRYAAAYRERYPLGVQDGEVPSDAQRFTSVVRRRLLDGQVLLAHLLAAGDDLPSAPEVAPADRPAMLRLTRTFLGSFRAFEDPADSPAWTPDRFEYQFDVAAPVGQGEVVLTTDEYDWGTLDWHSFQLAADTALLGAAADTDAGSDLGRIGLPSTVTYKGMPRARFWQFEDAAVDFGDLRTSPEELTKTLFIEFGLVYGNDHFLVPLDVTVGSLCDITAVSVTDTFGRVTEVPHSSVADAARPTTFRLFELGADDRRSALFLLPPTTLTTITDRPVEAVSLQRDEGANLCWAVETLTTRIDGFPTEPIKNGASSEGSPPAGADPAAAWRYRLQTSVPEGWYPMVPVAESPGVNHLELRTLLRADGSVRMPTGAILAELQERPVPEEELSRTNTRVIRSWQYTRWVNGRQHLWLGRRRELRQNTADSGLRFDDLESRK